ncbi:MAG: FtsQ-type POTRA domain-containing protein [Acidobacteria bacterium]|nr:FtsQ-type POTRA domain-containing protein [Acidobacteriota bacterium]
MARRGVTDELEYPLLQQGIEEESREAVRSDSRDEESRPRRRARVGKDRDETQGAVKRRKMPWYYWLLPVAALLVAFLLVAAFHRVEAFLIADDRFHLPAPADSSEDPPGMTLQGLQRANKSQVLRVFEQDLGRSLYLFSVAERRRNLLAVDWIKDATVSRRWPNHVHVTVVERQPAAFVQLPGDSAPEFKVIDIDGVLMPIPSGERLSNLLVLTGMSASDTEASRRIRVREAMVMQREIGALASRLSEADVRDPGNLRVTMRIDDASLLLKIGNKNYKKRLENFLQHYAGIYNVKPNAKTFDLRIDGRITAVEEGRGE